MTSVTTVPERGTIDVDAIVRANPQQAVLSNLNLVIATAQRPSPIEKTAFTLPSVSLRADAARGSTRANSAPYREQRALAFQSRRLNALQDEILSNLDARLQRADNQRLASLQARLGNGVEQSYLGRVDSIDDAADAGELNAAVNDRTKAVNLLAKIHALTVDVQPPPTAPEGYWSTRLLARKTELDLLNARRRALVSQILTDRDRRRSELRAQLERDADVSYQDEAASSKLRRDTLLATTELRLRAQTSEILASAKALDGEASSADTSAGRLLAGRTASSLEELPEVGPMPVSERRDFAALILERARLQDQIRRQTLRTVMEVARTRHAVILGYGHQVGVRDITGDLLKWITADRWG